MFWYPVLSKSFVAHQTSHSPDVTYVTTNNSTSCHSPVFLMWAFSSFRSFQEATMTWTVSSLILRTTSCITRGRSSMTAFLTPQLWRASTKSASAMNSPLSPIKSCTWTSAMEMRSLSCPACPATQLLLRYVWGTCYTWGTKFWPLEKTVAVCFSRVLT